MTGKDFSDFGEAAMSFFSTPTTEEPADTAAQAERPTPTPKAMPTPKAPAKKRQGAASSKKPATDAHDAPDGFKVDARFVEMKTKRVQLVLQPSLFLKAKEKADALGVSFNELASQALAAFVEPDCAKEK